MIWLVYLPVINWKVVRRETNHGFRNVVRGDTNHGDESWLWECGSWRHKPWWRIMASGRWFVETQTMAGDINLSTYQLSTINYQPKQLITNN